MPSSSPFLGERVVQDTLSAKLESLSTISLAIVPFPTPEGPDITTRMFLIDNMPRLFEILDLLSDFFYFVFERERVARHFYIVGFGTNGVGFAVEFLH